MENSYHLEDIGVNKEIYRRARRHWSQSMPGVKINGKLSISLSHLPTNWSTFKFLSRKLCPFFLTAPLSHQFKSRKKKKKRKGERNRKWVYSFLVSAFVSPFPPSLRFPFVCQWEELEKNRQISKPSWCWKLSPFPHAPLPALTSILTGELNRLSSTGTVFLEYVSWVVFLDSFEAIFSGLNVCCWEFCFWVETGWRRCRCRYYSETIPQIRYISDWSKYFCSLCSLLFFHILWGMLSLQLCNFTQIRTSIPRLKLPSNLYQRLELFPYISSGISGQ